MSANTKIQTIMNESAWVRYGNPKRLVHKRGQAETRYVNKRTTCEHCGKNALNIMYHYEHVHPGFWDRYYTVSRKAPMVAEVGSIYGVRIVKTV